MDGAQPAADGWRSSLPKRHRIRLPRSILEPETVTSVEPPMGPDAGVAEETIGMA